MALKAAATDATSGLQHLHLRPQSAHMQDAADLITTTIEQQESTELSVPERKQPTDSKQPMMGTLRPALKDVQQGDVTLSMSFGECTLASTS